MHPNVAGLAMTRYYTETKQLCTAIILSLLNEWDCIPGKIQSRNITGHKYNISQFQM